MHADGRPHLWRFVLERLRGPVAAAIIAVLVASPGYVLIEGWGWMDAVYMSVITMGQVGFGEVRPLSTAGRVWTMGAIVSGFGVFVYASASLTALFLSGEVRAILREKRRSTVRDRLEHHVVVVGFGRVGRASAVAAVRSGRACVVVDTDDGLETDVTATGAVFLHGDARDVSVLRNAGVARATAVITSVDDPSNAVVTLTARSLAPDVRIVARVNDAAWSERLLRAGASHVVPVYESVGSSLAATALDAEVVGVLTLPGTDMRVEEIEVGAGSAAVGRDIRSLMDVVPDVHILGLRHPQGMRRWHEADGPLLDGDLLVVMGTATGLGRLTSMVRHDPAAERP